jgi:hypothetical protein
LATFVYHSITKMAESGGVVDSKISEIIEMNDSSQTASLPAIVDGKFFSIVSRNGKR